MITLAKQSGSVIKLTMQVTLLIVGLGFLYMAFSGKELIVQASEHTTIDRGSKIYAEHCASCHGVNLEGEPNWTQRNADGLMPAPPHDETGHTWHHSDETLFILTKYGLGALVGENYDYRTNMPAYEKILTDEEIWAVFDFIKSTWPEELREIQKKMTH